MRNLSRGFAAWDVRAEISGLEGPAGLEGLTTWRDPLLLDARRSVICIPVGSLLMSKMIKLDLSLGVLLDGE